MLTAQMPLDATPPLRWHSRRSEQSRILRHVQPLSSYRIRVEYALVEIVDEAEGRVYESGRSGELRVTSWGDVGSAEGKQNDCCEVRFSKIRRSRNMDERRTIRRKMGSIYEVVVAVAR